jgi:catechol 2,3-dioxygenase-like lactoylglutathione lyase family enzyme
VQSQKFYRDVLGLTFVRDDGPALVFDVGGRPLRIQKVQQLGVVQHTVLGWLVSDITHTVSALGAQGVVFERYPQLDQDTSAIWTSPGGAKVAWFRDPDGNTLSVTED